MANISPPISPPMLLSRDSLSCSYEYLVSTHYMAIIPVKATQKNIFLKCTAKKQN